MGNHRVALTGALLGVHHQRPQEHYTHTGVMWLLLTSSASPLPALPANRLLKPGGVLINITYGEPAARVPLLQRMQFEVSFYIMSKSQELAAGAAVQGAAVGTREGITMHGPLDASTQVGAVSVVPGIIGRGAVPQQGMNVTQRVDLSHSYMHMHAKALLRLSTRHICCWVDAHIILLGHSAEACQCMT